MMSTIHQHAATSRDAPASAAGHFREVDGPALLDLARRAILARAVPPGVYGEPPWLDEPGAVFVTLTLDGRLRGRGGSSEPHRSLREDVAHNACAAAFHDPRFPPLAARDVPAVRIEVALLHDVEPVPFGSHRELLARLRPGVDGVTLSWHGHSATFLPQMWTHLREPEDFLEHLLHAARLPVLFWEPDLRVRRFGTTTWAEE